MLYNMVLVFTTEFISVFNFNFFLPCASLHGKAFFSCVRHLMQRTLSKNYSALFSNPFSKLTETFVGLRVHLF